MSMWIDPDGKIEELHDRIAKLDQSLTNQMAIVHTVQTENEELRAANDALCAEKDALLAALKDNIRHGSETYHDRVGAEARALIARIEAKP